MKGSEAASGNLVRGKCSGRQSVPVSCTVQNSAKGRKTYISMPRNNQNVNLREISVVEEESLFLFW